MAKFLKITSIILVFLALGASMHFGIFSNLPIIRDFQKNAVLTVNTRRGVADIYLDGVDYGQTPTSITNLAQGGYTVELKKITENPDIYPTQSFYIELYRNTEAVIDIEIAPNDFKSGHILFYAPIPRTFNQEGAISVRSELRDYEIRINDERVDKENIIGYSLEPGEYEIKVSSDGYEPIEFPAIVREGYDLNIRVYLLPIPINF